MLTVPETRKLGCTRCIVPAAEPMGGHQGVACADSLSALLTDHVLELQGTSMSMLHCTNFVGHGYCVRMYLPPPPWASSGLSLTFDDLLGQQLLTHSHPQGTQTP
jgi:hypothetical protein